MYQYMKIDVPHNKCDFLSSKTVWDKQMTKLLIALYEKYKEQFKFAKNNMDVWRLC